MAATRMCTRSLALLCLFGQSRGFEDVESLIQQRQAVDALEASSELQESARALPDVGADGIRMSRLSATAEAGSNLFLNYSAFCEQEDAFGPKECALYYETPLWQTFKIHLNGGLNSGDVLMMGFNISLDHNKSSFWSLFAPKNINVGVGCGLCENSDCVYNVAKTNFSLNITTPTIIDDAAICGNTTTPKQEEFVISNASTYWLKPPGVLALSGDVTMSTGVYDSLGNARVHGTYRYRMTPPSSPFSLAAEKIVGARQPIGPLDLLRKTFVDRLTGSEADSHRVSLRDFIASLGNHSHTIELNLTIKGIASGSSITIMADKGCTATDSLGSVACELPLNDTVTIDAAADLAFTAAEGGTLYASSKTSVGGNLGIIFGQYLKKKEMSAPICGPAVTITDMKGLTHDYQPGKCGGYAVKLSSTGFKQLADFTNFDFPEIPLAPFMPKTFDDILPLSEVSEFELKNPDNSTIVSFELGIGLKKV